MRTIALHHLRSVAAAATLGATALALAGCDCLVSRNQSFNTSFGEMPERTTYRVGGPATPVTGSKVIIIPSDDPVIVDDNDNDNDNDGRPVTVVVPAGASAVAAPPGGVVSGAQALTADQQRFTSSINSQVTAMRTRMNELAASAKIKGAAAEAALAPHQRAFNTSAQEIQSRFDGARSVSADVTAWSALETGVNDLLKQAQKSVDDAVRDVEAVPTNK